jgi:hypothetical protein
MSADGSGTTFWSLESLRAGLFLIPRLGPIIGPFALFGYVMASSSRCGHPARVDVVWWGTVMSLGILVASFRLPRLARAWAQRRYSSTVQGSTRWTIVWRGLIVTLASLDALVLLGGTAPLVRAGLLAAAAVVIVLGWGWGLSVACAPRSSQPDRTGGWRRVLRPSVALAVIATVVLVTASMNAGLFRSGC